MTTTGFVRIYQELGDSVRLEAAYDSVLAELFKSPFWENGPVVLQRILWSRGRQARTEDTKAFGSPGLYLWGIEERPLYIGITRSSFGKRFSRYIWNERSQCNLAERFEGSLASDGIDGFPAEITLWYQKNFRGSQVRLRGAVRFAEEGIAKVWFALFPHSSVSEIRELEKALIPVAEKRNQRRSLRPLLNIQEHKLRN